MNLVALWFKKYFQFFKPLNTHTKQKGSSFLMFFLTYTFVIIGIPANAVTLTQIGSDIDGEAAGDQSGRAVSLSADGSRVAIGAPFNIGSGNYSGHVRIYQYTAGSWVQLGSDIVGETASSYSGWSVSLSADGSRVAIGAIQNNGGEIESGHVRIYQYNGSSWTQLGSDIDGEAAGDQSGRAVNLSADGSRVAIAAASNDGSSSNSGHTRIYQYNGSSWVQLGSDIDAEAAGDRTGWSVSLSADGSRVATGGLSGHARIYQYNGSSWVQLGSGIDGEAAGDQSGRAVSLSADGSRVAIGAPFNDGGGSNSGHARIYQYNGSSWIQLGSDIDGEAADDQSGYSVSLSADGSRVAIGAWGNDGGGTRSGHVRIYQWNGSSWTQLDSDIDGEAAEDQSGLSVSLSADGSRVAIGAIQNDGHGSNSGHVRLYELFKACGDTSTALTENKWWSISRPCGTLTNPTIAEIFNGAGLGIYGDADNWVLYKLNGTNPDGTENYTMVADTDEVMKSGVGYWIITDQTGVNWNPGAIGESADPTGASWNVATVGTVTPASLSIADTDVKEFLVLNPVTDGSLTLVQDDQLALIGNPFNKSITWSNVYFSNNGTTYTAIDGMTSGVKPTAFVSDPDSSSGQPYKAISSTFGFTNVIESRQAFWILMTGDVTPHSTKKIALPLEYNGAY